MISSVSSIDVRHSTSGPWFSKTPVIDRVKEEALWNILDQGVFEKLFESFCLSQEDPISQIKEKIHFLSQVKLFKEKDSGEDRKQIAINIYQNHFLVNGIIYF